MQWRRVVLGPSPKNGKWTPNQYVKTRSKLKISDKYWSLYKHLLVMLSMQDHLSMVSASVAYFL